MGATDRRSTYVASPAASSPSASSPAMSFVGVAVVLAVVAVAIWIASGRVAVDMAGSPEPVQSAVAGGADEGVALLELYVITDAGAVLQLCSGAPLAGTDLVATAAHCVSRIDATAEHWVHWDGWAWPVVAVRWDRAYRMPDPAHDGAVVQVATGDGRRIGDGPGAYRLEESPAGVLGVSAVGFQYPVGRVRLAEVNVKRCEPTAEILVGPGSFRVPCDLQPGASGGPVTAQIGGLIGVISTISDDGTNGVAPVVSIWEARSMAAAVVSIAAR